jgi:hypothetical protein
MWSGLFSECDQGDVPVVEVDPVQSFERQHGKESLKVGSLMAYRLGEATDKKADVVRKHAQSVRS